MYGIVSTWFVSRSVMMFEIMLAGRIMSMTSQVISWILYIFWFIIIVYTVLFRLKGIKFVYAKFFCIFWPRWLTYGIVQTFRLQKSCLLWTILLLIIKLFCKLTRKFTTWSLVARPRSKEIGGKPNEWWRIPFNAKQNVNLSIIDC